MKQEAFEFGVRPIREAFLVWISIVTIATLSFGAIYNLSISYGEKIIERELVEYAEIGASMIDGEAHRQLVSPDQAGGATYMRLIEPLIKYHQLLPDIHYMYTVVKKDDKFYFILDTAKFMREARAGMSLIHNQVMDSYADPEDTLIEVFERAAPLAGKLLTDDLGTFKSGFAPFFDKNGELSGVFGADMDMRSYNARVSAIKRVHLFGVLLFVALATVVAVAVGVLRANTLKTLTDANRERQRQEEELLTKNHENELLLTNILPSTVVKRLKSGEKVIADSHERVTVMFIDLVGFTTFSSLLTAREVVYVLNRIFGMLDELAITYRLEKIKTIGDSYMTVGGLDPFDRDHMRRVAAMALDAVRLFNEIKAELNIANSGIRIGIATGPVVAGVIGSVRSAYDLWGSTVNTASRMESYSLPDKIHCEETFAKFVEDEFIFEDRGESKIRGRGMMHTYFLVGRR
ncbi:MAG: adenylate/guanylate cyclase domain-containing protein [Helicobacteraceae bacterium]|jgi:class 3 adenylate cyclase|nr:adenylate/guanylate cyclase domain-containing protein [Helicobacteraceae bacterium]